MPQSHTEYIKLNYLAQELHLHCRICTRRSNVHILSNNTKSFFAFLDWLLSHRSNQQFTDLIYCLETRSLMTKIPIHQSYCQMSSTFNSSCISPVHSPFLNTNFVILTSLEHNNYNLIVKKAFVHISILPLFSYVTSNYLTLLNLSFSSLIYKMGIINHLAAVRIK